MHATDVIADMLTRIRNAASSNIRLLIFRHQTSKSR
jgi:ribosomal protein S8